MERAHISGVLTLKPTTRYLYFRNGIITTYTYDALNRLDLETITGGSELATYDYVVRSDGLRSSVTERHKEPDGSYSNVRVSYTYDAVGRLKSEFRDVSSSSSSAVFSSNGQVDSAGDYLDSFTFDLANNRQTKIHDDHTSALDETIAYTYTTRDQLTGEDSSTINANDASHTYNDNGSQITATKNGTPTTYKWDLRNHMSGIDANNDGDTTDAGDTRYTYDIRIARTADSV